MRRKSSFRYVKSELIYVNSDLICEKSTRKRYSYIVLAELRTTFVIFSFTDMSPIIQKKITDIYWI